MGVLEKGLLKPQALRSLKGSKGGIYIPLRKFESMAILLWCYRES